MPEINTDTFKQNDRLLEPFIPSDCAFFAKPITHHNRNSKIPNENKISVKLEIARSKLVCYDKSANDRHESASLKIRANAGPVGGHSRYPYGHLEPSAWGHFFEFSRAKIERLMTCLGRRGFERNLHVKVR